MKGAILKKGEEYYTNLKDLFYSIEDSQLNYNWFITDMECYSQNKKYSDLFNEKYCFVTGEELTKIVNEEELQWIWAVFTGFSKEITLDQIKEYDLPFADGNTNLWKNPVNIQHPLGSIEIVAWDSSATILISKDEEIIKKFRSYFIESKDLEKYNLNQ